MSWSEYSRLRPEWPYILRLDSSAGTLFYFGAAHTFDPADAQFALIEREWDRFRPDIAFTEGGSPPIKRTRDEAIQSAGEPGFVRFLAARDNVPTTTLDPSRAEEVAELTRYFSREHIKLFFILRTVSQYVQRVGVSGLPQELDYLLGVYSAMPGLRGSPRTIEELDAAYSQLFPDRAGLTDVEVSWFDPVASETLFNEISRASSDYRDLYMVSLLTRHVADGHRVFAVVGGSHVVMQEAALRARVIALR